MQAKELKHKLQTEFPAIRFSVRSGQRYLTVKGFSTDLQRKEVANYLRSLGFAPIGLEELVMAKKD